MLRLGLCCLNNTLREEKDIYPSRTWTLATMVKHGGLSEELIRRIDMNLDDLEKMLDWNAEHKIWVFRLSSDLFPHYTNELHVKYSLDRWREKLARVGKKARDLGIRLNFHPGQFNVVGTPNKDVLQQTIRELDYHAEVLELMGMGPDATMVVHGGGVYGNKEATIDRWVEQFGMLTDRTRPRLVLENCERCYSIVDCLEISRRVNERWGIVLPVVFDTHHHQCYQMLNHASELDPSGEAYAEAILATWAARGIRPEFHISEQGEGRIGHHSDYISEIPAWILALDVDLMVEAKAKERAILRLYELYPEIVGDHRTRGPTAEETEPEADDLA